MTRDEYRIDLVRLADELEHREQEYVAAEIIRMEYDMGHVVRIIDHVLRFVAAIAMVATGSVVWTLVALGMALAYAYRITTQEGF